MTITDAEAADLFRAAPSRYLDAGDGRGEIAYRTVGSGPDVLFVHGWPANGATFRHLLPHLADHVTCHVLDLPGLGSSRYDASTELSFDNLIASVRRAVDVLELDELAVVGHDAGGLIARHAMTGDARLRAMGLIDTEPEKVGWRFKSFIAGRQVPGFGAAFGWVAGKPRLRRTKFVLGDVFVDRSLLDGGFDEFILRPLYTSDDALDAAMRLLKSFSYDYIDRLPEIHARLDVPVRLVWGEQDRFFPVQTARDMVTSFPNADLVEIPGAGVFANEEAPEEVAAALLPVLTG